MLQVGTKAPGFTAKDQDGREFSLEPFKGKTVLYFYSRDNTGGCTKQAEGYAALHGEFLAKGARVIGVSRDSAASHAKFAAKYGLPFTLIADVDRAVIGAYDVWKEKKNYGKVTMGVLRTTYIIDENGVIIDACDKVRAADDAARVLALL